MRRRTGFALFALLAAGSVLAGTAVLPPGAVLIDAGTAKPDAAQVAMAAGAVLARAAAGDADGAFAALRRIEDPLRFELTAARVVAALQEAPGAGAPALLAKLEGVPPRVFRRHEETAADWFLPVFDIAAKARSARLLLERRTRREAWLARLAADPKAALAAGAKHGEDPALVDAIAQASPALIARLVEAAAKADAALPSAAQAALAARSGDAHAWRLALRESRPLDVLPLFARVDTALGDAEARAWLQEAAAHPAYASAAAMAATRLAGTEALAALDSAEQGAEAAAVLAQRPDAIELAERALADPSASPTRLAHLVLMLRLIDDAAARARLQALRDDPRLPAAVRAELQR